METVPFRVGPTEVNPGIVIGLWGFAAIDLNGDGKIDLVIAQGGGIAICLGNGDGTFQKAVIYGPVGGGWVVLGDFNGDGIPDVALSGSNGAYVFIGKGGGVFNPGVLTPVNPSSSTYNRTLATADFNGDGKLDLVVASLDPNGFLVMLGNGDGTFQTPVLYPLAGSPNWVAAGDLNGDGHPDIVVSSGGALIYLNNGYGKFIPTISVPLSGPQLAIGNVNGDNIPDLVGSGGSIAFGLGHGKFAAPVSYPVETSGPVDVVLAELTTNGRTDIVAAQYGVLSVLLNEGNGTFVDGRWTSVPGSGNCGAAADFNGDGKPDLAVPTSSGMTALFGTGNASAPYTTGPSFTESGIGCPITADLNGDGIPDLLVGANGLGGVGAYLGNGDGTFQLASVIPVGSATDLVVGDFNHDGKLDFADSSNEMALGNGDGTFQAPVPILADPPEYGFAWIAAGDINNDGWTDLFAVQPSFGYGALYVMLNNQKGGFTLTTIPDADGGANSVTLADLNGDGNLDAVIVTMGAYAMVLLGNGAGGFKVSQTEIKYPFQDELPTAIGDVNGDGIPDLILPADGSIGIALGAGNGTFRTPVVWGVGPAVGQIFFENLHGQSATAGLPDIVAPDSSGGVMVLLNTTK